MWGCPGPVHAAKRPDHLFTLLPPKPTHIHAAFVIPSSSAQVRAALVCSESAQLPFVVRGGGHSYTAASLLSGGVVIDLRNMVGMGVQPAQTLV